MPSNSRENKKLHKELAKQMLTLATSGFGLVAALAWNSLIQEFVNSYIKKFLPNGSGIISLLIYALVVTALAVFVTYQLSRFSEKLQK
jgi:membrane protein YdbS with pleckstrin-like domain